MWHQEVEILWDLHQRHLTPWPVTSSSTPCVAPSSSLCSTFLLAFPHLQLQLYIFSQGQEALVPQNPAWILAGLLIRLLKSSEDGLWSVLLVSWPAGSPIKQTFFFFPLRVRNSRCPPDPGSTLENGTSGFFWFLAPIAQKLENHRCPLLSRPWASHYHIV